MKMYIWLKRWIQTFHKVWQTIHYTMLVLNAKIYLIIISPISSKMLIKMYGFIWHSCDINEYNLNEVVYIFEEVRTNIPESKTNNPLWYVDVKC